MGRLDADQWLPNPQSGFLVPRSVEPHTHGGSDLLTASLGVGPLSPSVFGTPIDATASANGAGSAATIPRSDHAHRGGIAVATSGARPGSPYVEEYIGETDTGLLKYWDGSNWVTQTNLRMFGITSALSGTPPAINTGSIPFKVQAGTDVRTTNGAGGSGAINFPTAFPNGLICVVVVGGDGANKDNNICTLINQSTTSFEILNVDSAGVRIASVALRWNWIAIGW